MSLHVDTPAGEVENCVVTFCSEGDIMPETMDLKLEVQKLKNETAAGTSK